MPYWIRTQLAPLKLKFVRRELLKHAVGVQRRKLRGLLEILTAGISGHERLGHLHQLFG